ncbi:MAG: carboxylate--amine ligase [Candidatus Limnocylindria bacterium]
MIATRGRPAAVVVGLDCITGLQTARILARRKVPVVGIAARRDHFCARTRACEEIIAAETSGEGLLRALERLGPRLGERAVLFPCTDLSVLTISRGRERLSDWYHVLLPDAEVVEVLMDKVRFVAYAQQQGLPIPATFVLRGRQDAEAAAAEMRYPGVMKPALKTPAWQAATKAKAFKVHDAAEMLSVYDRCSAWTDVLLAQQWIAGGEEQLYSCNCYFDARSEPIVTFVARKIRQWPPETGTSCLGEEVRNDVVLRETIRLFRACHYRGLGYVEMKRDARTGEHFIVEPNVGRPTGRSAIAEAGGVELLYAAYCDATGRPLPDRLKQRYGTVKWIYLRHDLQAALHHWRRGELSLRGWWRSIRGRKVDAVFSWADPVPFIADCWNAARLVLRRG